MAVDLSSILSKPASEVLPPKPLPNGVYVLTVKDFDFRPEVGEKKNPMVSFDVEATMATDVDPSECELPKKLKHDLWLTDNALFRFKQFLETDLAIESSNRTLSEMLPEAKGRMFRAEIIQKPYTRKGETEATMINEIKRTFPLEG